MAGSPAFFNGGVGSLTVSGAGTVVLKAADTYTGGTQLGGGGTLELAATGAAGSGPISFTATGTTLRLDSGVTLTNIIQTPHNGDVIDLLGYQGGSAAFDPFAHTITATLGGNSLVLSLDPALTPSFTVGNDAGGTGLALAFAACYAAGTRIATAAGETAVEDLRPGDRVRSHFGGLVPVSWIGHRRVDCRRHPRPESVWPVRVRAGAFGHGLPARDLLLSPDHSVYLQGALIPIRYLVDEAMVVQEPVPAIRYFHVELPAHDVILAGGLPAESYLDTGNRAAFENGGGAVALHPDFALRVWETRACAPLAVDGPPVAAARAALLERSVALSYALTDDPSLVLLADGVAASCMREGNLYRFALPPGARAGRLISRHFRPARLLGGTDDDRRLGIGIAAITRDGAALPLDDAALGAGWYAAEAGLRWTDEDAALDLSGAAALEIEIGMAGLYREAPQPAARRSRAV